MSSSNPYAPTQAVSSGDISIRKVQVRPIDLLKRSYRMMGEQYWLFLGITLVGILVGSAVPFGIIMGPMMVGIYLCFIERGQKGRAEFATLFRGFDYFLDAFLAFLILFLVTLVVMVPFMIALFAMILGPVLEAANAANQGNGPPPQPEISPAVFVLYIVMIIVNVIITMPFLFTFQLIADRKLKAMAAVKTSVRGVLKNVGGIIYFMIVLGIISMIAAMMCYIPAILLMPISFGALFLLYREIFGSGAAAPPQPQVPSQPQAPSSI